MPRLLFVSQIGLLISTICTVPTIASNVAGEQRRFAGMTLQILSFVVLIVGFGLWVFGTEALGIWIAYAVALILLLEVGGHVIQWYLDRTLSSLSSSRVGSNMRDAATAIENMFRRESILYIAVPLGLVVGTIVGLFRRLSPHVIVGLCLQIVLLVA
jgi:hypothetical protein